MKTSQLGKIKTVVQMGGLATYFLTLFSPPHAMPWIHLGCTIGFAVIGALFAIRRKGAPPSWVIVAVVLWFLVFVGAFFMEPLELAFWQFIIMVVLTWVSGADYLWGAGRALVKAGLRGPDVARIAWAIIHGLAFLPFLDEHFALAIPAILAVCAELSYGGIDNAVAAERGRFAKGGVIVVTVLAAVAGFGVWTNAWSESIMVASAWVLAAVTIAHALYAFVRDRDVFLAPERPLAA